MSEKYDENAQAVQSHLNITQSVIQRMASNSASCKAWCITLVSAILVIVSDKNKPQFALIAVIPTVLFFVLDIYYLALERRFREAYNLFIDKLHSQHLTAKDLYVISPAGKCAKVFFSSLLSFSIWPFYLTILLMIVISIRIVL